MATSGGIAGERLTCCHPAVAVLANACATLAVILAAHATRRRPQTLAALVAQVLGAAAGVTAVHLLLRGEALAAFPWLSEGPGQLVNDAVAVAGLLALSWAFARGLDARLLASSFGVVTVYRLTGPMWHLDRTPGLVHATVQQLVVAQLVAAAVALGLYRVLGDRAGGT